MALSKKSALLFLVLLLVFPALGWGDSRHKIVSSFQDDGGNLRFDGSFEVTADPQVVWDVLTDYDNRSRFVSNIDCHVKKRDGNEVTVYLTARGSSLFGGQEVKGSFKVQEEPIKSISFEETSHKAFDDFQGDWTMQARAGSPVKVTYRLEAKKNRFTPAFVTPGLIRQSSEDLMTQMWREIERREALIDGMDMVKEVPYGKNSDFQFQER